MLYRLPIRSVLRRHVMTEGIFQGIFRTRTALSLSFLTLSRMPWRDSISSSEYRPHIGWNHIATEWRTFTPSNWTHLSNDLMSPVLSTQPLQWISQLTTDTWHSFSHGYLQPIAILALYSSSLSFNEFAVQTRLFPPSTTDMHILQTITYHHSKTESFSSEKSIK